MPEETDFLKKLEATVTESSSGKTIVYSTGGGKLGLNWGQRIGSLEQHAAIRKKFDAAPLLYDDGKEINPLVMVVANNSDPERKPLYMFTARHDHPPVTDPTPEKDKPYYGPPPGTYTVIVDRVLDLVDEHARPHILEKPITVKVFQDGKKDWTASPELVDALEREVQSEDRKRQQRKKADASLASPMQAALDQFRSGYQPQDGQGAAPRVPTAPLAEEKGNPKIRL